MNFSYQGRHPPSQLAVNSMNSQSPVENTNSLWLPHSGYNAHMMNELANSIIIMVRKLSLWGNG